jgi:predicted murein hydrolase (TIGR00659 family)
VALPSAWADPLPQGVLWSAATVAVYFAAKALHRRHPRWWLMPLLPTALVLGAALWVLHVPYLQYSRATHWLPLLLGPATVAFAVPIHQHRGLIRRQWRVLLLAMVAGSTTAVATGWLLASALGLDEILRLSLLPRSISTPFAMSVSDDIGGIPELTALFVVLTGVLGGLVGDLMLAWLPLRSALARGAALGMAAHGAGTAKAYEVGQQEGTIAGLTMVLVGLLNVLVAPALVFVAQKF